MTPNDMISQSNYKRGDNPYYDRMMDEAMKPLTENEIDQMMIKNAPLMVNVHTGQFKVLEDFYREPTKEGWIKRIIRAILDR